MVATMEKKGCILYGGVRTYKTRCRASKGKRQINEIAGPEVTQTRCSSKDPAGRHSNQNRMS
jgi:hypothetical protein